MTNPPITQELVKEFLQYDPETGVLTWRRRGQKWFASVRTAKAWNTRWAGKQAGAIDISPRGYPRRCISFCGKNFKEHQIIWLYMTGSLPEFEVDHKDRDATNNRWLNLQDVPRMANIMNKSMRTNNSSGITGVSWSARAGKWLARVVLDGRLRLDRLFDDKNKAIEAVQKAHADLGFSVGYGSRSGYHG